MDEGISAAEGIGAEVATSPPDGHPPDDRPGPSRREETRYFLGAFGFVVLSGLTTYLFGLEGLLVLSAILVVVAAVAIFRVSRN